MFSAAFPNPSTYDFPEWLPVGDYLYYAHDIVAFDVPLNVENLRTAYRNGIFPWHINGVPLPWFCPEKRAILEFDKLTIPRSLAKERRKNLFTFTTDKAFREVIENCAKTKRPDQGGTWITKDFIRAYCELHQAGMGHSVEAWDANGDLAGGLYGVDAGGVFCGESMFYRRPNASKLALLFLIDHLKAHGSSWLDAQVMTPHMKAIGAKDISREVFLDKLKKVQKLRLRIF
jgi:leucyl/phenylalanyl-tRNA--protein transferase